MSVSNQDSGVNITNSLDQPSGIGASFDGSQSNSPLAVITGTGGVATTSVLSGTDKNSPKVVMKWQWDKYAFVYNGYFSMGGFYDGSALYKSITERDDQYAERKGTAYYRNYVRPIIDATYLPVFSSNATRKTEVKGVLDEDGKLAPLWNAFLDDCDNRKSHIQKFVKTAVKYSNMLGVSFVVMDNLPSVFEITQDAIDNRTYPYLYIRYPQQVEPSQLVLDEFCKIKQIAFREMPEKVIDAVSGQEKMESRWKLWTEEYSVKLRKPDGIASSQRKVEYEEIPGTKSVHNLGIVPVIAVMSGDVEDGTVLPHPRFYPIVDCNWALYNIDSAQMRLIRSQMFAMLVKPATPDNDGRTPQSVGPLQGIEMPPDRDGISNHVPFYLAPPTGPYTELSNTTKQLSDELYRLAGQEGVVGVGKASNKSGLAQSFDFQAMEWVLQETAKVAANLEEFVAVLFKKYVTSEEFDYECLYEDNYHPSDMDEDVQLYTDYINVDVGPLGKGLAKEQLTRSVFSDLDDELVQPVIDEIRAMAKEEQKAPIVEQDPVQMNMFEQDPEQQLQQDSFKKANSSIVNTPQKKVSKIIKKGFSINQGDKSEYDKIPSTGPKRL